MLRGVPLLIWLAFAHAEEHHEPPSPPLSPHEGNATNDSHGSGAPHGDAHHTSTICYYAEGHNLCSAEHDSHTDPIDYLLFPMSALLVSVVAQMICSKFRINVPITVILFIYGLLLGLIVEKAPTFAMAEATIKWTNADPHLYFYLVLPLLVFNDALHLPMHTFFKIFNSATLLATVGVAVGAILIALLSYYALPLPEELQFTFYEAMTLGSITSATDPVAALAVLKSSGASARLSTL